MKVKKAKVNQNVTKIYEVTDDCAAILKQYYEGKNIAEVKYEGSDEELLNVFLETRLDTGIINDSKVFLVQGMKNGEMKLFFSLGILEKEVMVKVSEIKCKDRKVIFDNSSLKMFENDMTILMYMLNFIKKYPKFKIKFSTEDFAKIILFPFAREFRMINYSTLPEFFLPADALEFMTSKIEKEEMDNSKIYYPFENFVINFENSKLIICSYNDETNKLRVLLKEEGEDILLLNVDVESEEYALQNFILNLNGNHFIQKEIADQTLNVIRLVLYFYSHYKIEVEVKERNDDSSKKNNKKSKKYATSYKEKTIIVPRRIIRIDKDKIKNVRKRRKPLYTVKSWERAGHVRRYRDKDGVITKEVWIKQVTCNRKKEVSVEGKNYNKKFKISKDALSKATKQ